MHGSLHTYLFALLSLGICAPLAAQQLPYSEPIRLEAEGEMPEEPEEEEEEDEIETDRDSFTPAVTTTPWGRLIVESAYSFIDNDNVAETHSFPELLLRYGVNDWLEFRLGWNYEIGGASSPISGNVPGDFEEEAGIEEESRLIYGFKALLTTQDGWKPSSVVIVQGFTPTSGEATHTEMSATYVVGYVLENRWAWDSAIRYSTAGQEDDKFGVWSPSTVLKIPLGERWKAHAEYFGVFSSGRDTETVQHYFSPGAHYLINQDFEIGARVGWGLNDQAANFFANVGFGYRY
ncbi:transporter [Anatilimnocola sp. NA78]|uniref:transporter n=1 Tax=Anatilimnocola sp. NA78 TaxID=3415683 RepID=UPI003CE4C797